MSKLISSDDKNSRSLHDAIDKGDLEATMRMLAEGTSKDEVNRFGETPLYVAAGKGHLEIFATSFDRRG
jgi:ankyrin repeat protein